MRTATWALVIAVGVAGCDKKVDPAGSYSGAAHMSVRKVNTTDYLYPKDNKHAPVVLEKLTEQRYKVRFGECWAIVSRPKEKGDSVWAFEEGSTCKTSVGDIALSDGEMQVFTEAPGAPEKVEVRFSFSGLTPDGTVKADFDVAPTPRNP